MQRHVYGFVFVSQNHVIPQRVDVVPEDFLDCPLDFYGKVVVFAVLDFRERGYVDWRRIVMRFDHELRADGGADAGWIGYNHTAHVYYVTAL